jgi:flagellar hook-associated protein 1 FlgK
MSDLLAIGAAGVRAMQAALAQVGDNVANADTPGYVRRSLRLATGPSGAGTPLSRDTSGGAGVVSGAIIRSSDALAVNSARIAAGSHARHAARTDWLDRLQTVLIGSDLDARIGGFFDAGSELAAMPTSSAARAIFLDRTDQAASAFRDLGAGLANLASNIADATNAATTRINAIAGAIGQVNIELRRTSEGGAAANGLLDSRDALLAELATEVRITVSTGPRGTAIVRIGSSGAAALLVSAEGNASRVGVRDTGSGPELLLDPTHAASPVQLPANGSLAGLMDAARQIAATASEIDALASRFGAAINAWHAAGTDALGDPGGALLATRGLAITPGRANAGSAAVDVRVSDDQLLSPGGYRLLRDASGWTLARSDGSASVTGPGDLLLDGVTVRPGNGARDGDTWSLDIASGAAGLGLRPIGPAETG